jgi:O-antigen/teichoic acid export membrane protein
MASPHDLSAAAHVRRRTIAGMRGALALNVGTLPLSFVTNLILGRISPETLGYYSGIQIFIGSYFTFLVFGGIFVFTRFVPSLPPRDRVPFLASYTGLVASISAIAIAAALLVAPETVAGMLARFGGPPAGVACALLAASLVWGFGSYFLYSVLEATKATIVDKASVAGFFVAALCAWGPLRDRLAADPAGYLWWSALAVYAASALLAAVLVVRTGEFRARAPIRWTLPPRFLPTVVYTHLDTIANYVYATLSLAMVLFWLDAAALGVLTAAMRYVALLVLLPATMASVIGPAASRLEAAGMRGEAFRQAGAAMRTVDLGLVPAVVVLILFADDAMALFGPGFRGSGDVLRLAAVSLAAAPAIHVGAALAAGLGAFRAYLAASSIGVIATILGIAVLVPRYGLPGAAVALTVGAAARQAVVLGVLRARLGFPWPGRLGAGWAVTLAALLISLTVRPDRPLAAAAALGLVALFGVIGRVRWGEIRSIADKAVRGR